MFCDGFVLGVVEEPFGAGNEGDPLGLCVFEGEGRERGGGGEKRGVDKRGRTGEGRGGEAFWEDVVGLWIKPYSLMMMMGLTVPTSGSTGAPASTGATADMATSRARDERKTGVKVEMDWRRTVFLTFRGAALTAWTARLLLAAVHVG